MQRDAKNRTQLKDDGWQLLIIWESDIKRKRTRDSALEQIARFLDEG